MINRAASTGQQPGRGGQVGEAGKKLIKSAKQARAIVRGEADPATYRVHVPAELEPLAVQIRLEIDQFRRDTDAKFEAINKKLGSLTDAKNI